MRALGITVRPVDTTTYDYIVIGAGSAGCVLAYRLSQAGHSILVLEAGGSDEGIDEIAIPAAFPATPGCPRSKMFQSGRRCGRTTLANSMRPTI